MEWCASTGFCEVCRLSHRLAVIEYDARHHFKTYPRRGLFSTCCCRGDPLEEVFNPPKSDHDFLSGLYQCVAEFVAHRAQEAEEASEAAFWRQPILTEPHNETTLRAWNEAKAAFGISEDEEPGEQLGEPSLVLATKAVNIPALGRSRGHTVSQANPALALPKPAPGPTQRIVYGTPHYAFPAAGQ
ncbi:hypothetical protein L226DRAFT_531215 [Lentinus tigrinus ALCF2SS1-7]|uniref:uncharacterized protein n=1 Tax=Lentinus tigrinus ALCF2SS1-7 TaxID=1328758 RepID=UPI001166096B|nr:hypothetical protein L226DRAFT_531215 [Lentinus tigrinus ALCF2SS1-7]